MNPIYTLPPRRKGKKLYVLLFCLILGLGAMSFDDPVLQVGTRFVNWNWKEVNFQAKYQNKPIFLLVTAPYCNTSKRVEDNFKFKSVSNYYNTNFVSGKYLADQPSKTLRARRWGVTELPAYVYFDWDGTIIMQGHGYRNRDQLLADAEVALKKFIEIRKAREAKIAASKKGKDQMAGKSKDEPTRKVAEKPEKKPVSPAKPKDDGWDDDATTASKP